MGWDGYIEHDLHYEHVMVLINNIGIPYQQYCGAFEGGWQPFLPDRQRSWTTLWQALL